MPPARFAMLAALLLAPCAAAQDEKKDTPEQLLIDALAQGKVTNKGEYKLMRSTYAKFFESKYADDLRSAFDADYDDISKFLADNPDIRDTLFTAIDPDLDKVGAALKLFREVWKLDPAKLKTHPNLAVAVCVVWDDPKAVYDYRGHQLRTRSTLPGDEAKTGWKENYEYLLAREGDLKGAVQHLPWEFLVYMVNNRTPAAERDWAVKNYLKKRAGIGGVYKEVEYDTEMLRTEQANGVGKAECKLTGRDYTLENLRKFGGVCAQQADFAARVAKSLAVPAEYVSGEGNNGERHAWVMWVEVKAVNKEKVDFALVSEGRYSTDQYYVGQVEDPRSGRKLTDRDMERRLATVGVAPQDARHADLLMRAYPAYRESKSLTPKQRASFAKRVLEVFQHSERAWKELAEVGKDGTTFDATEATTLANKAFTTFANFPDFSWQLFDPLLTAQKDKTQRSAVYEKAVLKYEVLGRPDLACECRLKWAEYLTDAKEFKKAAEGLAQTISKFPDEGRYVPKVLDKLATVCGQYKDGTKKLAKFYLDFLPLVPKTRGNEVTIYAVKVHQQAADFFKANKMEKEAAAVDAVLATMVKKK
jgi:hypothetical protein